MEKNTKIKLYIGISYLILLSAFLFFFFSKFSLQEITSYDFIKENSLYLLEFKNSNLFLVSIIFLILSVGKKPPPETKVIVMFSELKSLSPEIFNDVKIKILSKVYIIKILKTLSLMFSLELKLLSPE